MFFFFSLKPLLIDETDEVEDVTVSSKRSRSQTPGCWTVAKVGKRLKCHFFFYDCLSFLHARAIECLARYLKLF